MSDEGMHKEVTKSFLTSLLIDVPHNIFFFL